MEIKPCSRVNYFVGTSGRGRRESGREREGCMGSGQRRGKGIGEGKPQIFIFPLANFFSSKFYSRD
jgi:hypothetical protein